MNFKRRLLSQNFFRDPELVAHLVGLAGIGREDTVVDVGAGSGSITIELAKISKHVIAVEIDPELVLELRRRFATNGNVEVHQADIRQFQLPTTPYKVFANIPFHITADIVYKLLYYSNPPEEAYLVLAKEAAEKFTGRPHETQFSVLAKPWFEFEVLKRIYPASFSPRPEVEVVFLRIKRRELPLVTMDKEDAYRSFVKYAFNTWKKDLKAGLQTILTYRQWKRLARNNGFAIHAKPTDLSFKQWLAIFKFFEFGVQRERKDMVIG